MYMYRRRVLRRVLTQTQIQRVHDQARQNDTVDSTLVSCKAAAILRCASNAGRLKASYYSLRPFVSRIRVRRPTNDEPSSLG